MHPGKANGFEQPHGPHAGGVAGVHGFVETHPHMRLRGKVVHLVGLDAAQQSRQASSVDQVAVVQEQSRTRLMWIDVEVVDPRRVERRGAADQPVDLIALAQQQFGEV